MNLKGTTRRIQSFNPTFRRRLNFLARKQHPFGQEALAELRALNAKFGEIEALCLKEASRIARELQFRIQDSDDAFTDFEIEAKVSVSLGEGDPAWDEDEDNTLAWREYWLTDGEGFFCDGDDWSFENDIRIRGLGPVCWMFRDFHCHSHQTKRRQDREWGKVSALDLLRIGKIWVDISAIHQWDLTL
jgi:hypothetical protein